MKVDVYHHFTPDSSGAILTLLQTIKTQGDQIMADQATLDAKVTELGTAQTAAFARFQAKLDAAIAAGGVAQATVDKLQAEIDAANAAAPAETPIPTA